MHLQLIITMVALLLIALTMFLRAHELKGKGFNTNLRRVGLSLSGACALGIVGYTLTGRDPAIWWTGFVVGVFLVFFTTPNGIPWTKWVWNGLTKDDEPASSEGEYSRPDRTDAINRKRDENP